MIALLCLCLLHATFSLKYEAPSSCTWSEDAARVVVTCRARALEPLISNLQVENTGKLRVECDAEVENDLEVQRLVYLDELDVVHCKVGSLHSFKKDLKRLTIHNWSRQLQISSLDGFKELQHLDLAFNLLSNVTRGAFCPLKSLNSLNISHNALTELDPGLLGVSTSDEDACDVDVIVLDASHNLLEDLPAFLTTPGRRRLQQLLVQNNKLAALRASSLAGLAALRVINASSNLLVDLPAVPLRESCRELREVHLQDNLLHDLGDTFKRLEQLLVLDVARNQLVNLDASLAGLIRLIVLDLSGNALTRLEPQAFKDLYSLQILELRDNALTNIADDTFLPLYNLHTLNLAGNQLASVGSLMFNGLFVLNKLTLSLNLITSVDPLAFRNCSDLKELDLSGNVLTEVPSALTQLPFLRTLDLGENRIVGFQNGSFKNLHQLTGLRLIDNSLGNVTADMLWDLTGLQVLNLAKNKIQHVERGAFQRNERLEAIRLDANYLTDVNGVFTALPNLVWLNLSENHLVWFDYAFIPPSLQWLDIHFNFVEKLGNYYEIVDGFHLRTLDVSNNRLTELNALSLPNSVEIFFVSSNKVRSIAPDTFKLKNNLTRVDLYANELQYVDRTALRVAGRDTDLPEFFLGGNPFKCDCTMEWMKNTTSILDLDDVTCDVVSARAFLCKYDTKCPDTCRCCDEDTCNCESKCPINCQCFRDEFWDLNVVDCSSSSHVVVPRSLPVDATELHLDGNKIREVRPIPRSSLLVLYLNKSRVENIQTGSFLSLETLELLYLNENNIEVLHGREFEGLAYLSELYLQNNRLVHIQNTTFAPLQSLKLLRLDGNLLTSFALWLVPQQNPELSELYLANNPWACRCRFATALRRYTRNSSGQAITGAEQCMQGYSDGQEVTCGVEAEEPAAGVEHYVAGVAAACALLCVLAVVLLWRRREQLKLWLFARYQLRLCAAARDDKDKLYDAYMVYSLKDEAQLVQYLTLSLESGYPRYTMCLHHRDLPQDIRAVVAAAEASRRVILVITRNFLQTEWARRELRSALSEALQDKGHKVIVVEEGLAPELERDPELNVYLKCSGRRLRWGDKLFWERLKFLMPEARQYRQNLNFTVDANGAGQTHGTFPERRKHPLFDLSTPGTPVKQPTLPISYPDPEVNEPVYSSINEDYASWRPPIQPSGRAYLV